MGNGKISLDAFKKQSEFQSNEKKFQKRDNRYGQKNNGNKNDEKKLEIEKIMKEIEKTGYRNKEKDVLRKELVSSQAKKIAQNMQITNSQLRAFFNELKKLKQKYIDENIKNIEKLHIELLILKSKLEYKKGGKKITPEFSEFIEKNIDIVINENTIQSYKDFLIFFETVLGYMYGLNKISNR